MLAVHWTPVSKTKTILKNGITKPKRGLYCFPLTGLKSLDRWWVHFFNQCGVRQRRKYNGIVFKLKQEDMPAYFGHWIGATNKDDFKKEITDLKTLEGEFRQTILWRLGEELAWKSNLNDLSLNYEEQNALYIKLAELEIGKSPKALTEKKADHNFMAFAFEDYQIVLTTSISKDRILKVLPQGDEFRRVLKQKKKYKSHK